MAKYLIVGGVAGGASTAARLRRNDEHAEIIMIERGAYVSYANCGLPYYAGGVIKDRNKLFVMTPEKFKETLNIDVRVSTEAVSIDRKNKSVMLSDLKSGKTYTESYDTLILSPGAAPVRPPIPGLDLEGIFTLRSVPDIDAIKSWIDTRRPEHAVVVGGGFIGLEMAENLAHRGSSVSVIEALDQVMAPLDFEMAALVHEQLRDQGVELRLNDAVASFEKRGSRIAVKLNSKDEVLTDIVLFSVGVKPDTKLAMDAGIETLPPGRPGAGAIIVDKFFKTNDEHIRAIGDAAATTHALSGDLSVVPLAGPANKQGRLLADILVFGESDTRRWKGPLGTSAAKVFDMTVAATGLSEKALERAGKPHHAVIVHPNSHASYYPDASTLSLKLVFDPENGKLLGAQAVGFDGADKRIDSVAALIGMGATVKDACSFEQVYAPPFSSAKDPVNMVAFAAENFLDGLSSPVSYRSFEEYRAKGAFILDVRTQEEFELGAIPEAVCIPNTELRDRLHEVPKDKTILVYCGVGLRGYLAERILRQNGYSDIYNLSGGYKTWAAAMEKQDNPGGGRKIMWQEDSGTHHAHSHGAIYDEGTGRPEGLIKEGSGKIVHLDACGLQCPGPIMQLRNTAEKAEEGTRILVSASDPGFARDVQSWCHLTQNTLISLETGKGRIEAVIEKGSGLKQKSTGIVQKEDATFIVFSNDMDKALASFVLANGAAAVGKQVTMFFTFWGLSVIQKKRKDAVKKDFMGRMFSFMLPKHAGKLSLSKMNFGGAGVSMMKSRMKAKQVDQLEAMIEQARMAGVHFIACQMSMDIMGVKKEELMDGVEIGGVAAYMEAASEAGLNLFI